MSTAQPSCAAALGAAFSPQRRASGRRIATRWGASMAGSAGREGKGVGNGIESEGESDWAAGPGGLGNGIESESESVGAAARATGLGIRTASGPRGGGPGRTPPGLRTRADAPAAARATGPGIRTASGPRGGGPGRTPPGLRTRADAPAAGPGVRRRAYAREPMPRRRARAYAAGPTRESRCPRRRGRAYARERGRGGRCGRGYSRLPPSSIQVPAPAAWARW